MAHSFLPHMMPISGVTMPSWHPVMSGNHSDKTEKEKEKVVKNPVSCEPLASLASKDRW